MPLKPKNKKPKGLASQLLLYKKKIARSIKLHESRINSLTKELNEIDKILLSLEFKEMA